MEKYVYICYTKLYTGGHLFTFDTQQPVYYKQKNTFFSIRNSTEFARNCEKCLSISQSYIQLKV